MRGAEYGSYKLSFRSSLRQDPEVVNRGKRRIFTINEQQNNDLSHPKIKQTIRDRGKTLGSGYAFCAGSARSEIDFDKRKFVQF
jgi:hypothetical protein